MVDGSVAAAKAHSAKHSSMVANSIVLAESWLEPWALGAGVLRSTPQTAQSLGP